MIRDHQRNTAQIVRPATHTAHRITAVEEVLRSNLADSQNDFRLDQFNLPLEIAATGRRLCRLGITIVRRATFEDIRNEHALAALPDREQHLVEQVPRPADEWLAAAILLGPR